MAHLDVLLKKSRSNTSVLKKKGTFSLILRWAASDNRTLINSIIGPDYNVNGMGNISTIKNVMRILCEVANLYLFSILTRRKLERRRGRQPPLPLLREKTFATPDKLKTFR